MSQFLWKNEMNNFERAPKTIPFERSNVETRRIYAK